MGDDEATPFGIDRRNIGEKRQKALKPRGFSVGLGRSEDQPISGQRSRAHTPEFNDVLWCYEYAITRVKKAGQGSRRHRVHGVGLVDTAEK